MFRNEKDRSFMSMMRLDKITDLKDLQFYRIVHSDFPEHFDF